MRGGKARWAGHRGKGPPGAGRGPPGKSPLGWRARVLRTGGKVRRTKIRWITDVAEHNCEISAAIGTRAFLWGRFMIHLQRSNLVKPDFDANLHFILGRRNTFVPTARAKCEIVFKKSGLEDVAKRIAEISLLIGTQMFLSRHV